MKRKIYRNLWAGCETYFIPTGGSNRSGKNEAKIVKGYGIIKDKEGNWSFEKNVAYYAKDLKNEQFFPVVGAVDIEEIIVQGILSGIKKTVDRDATISKRKEELGKEEIL